MCLGTMIWSLTHTESKPKASTCCASRRMFCIVAGSPRLGRLKPNSIRPLLVARYGAVMLAVVADLLEQSKSCGGLVVPGKVGYTGRDVSGFLAQLHGEYRLGRRSSHPRIGSDCRARQCLVLACRAHRLWL